MTDQGDVRRQLAAARLWAANRFPYLAQALFAQTVVVAPGSGAFGVDRRWRLTVDPVEIEGLAVDRLGTALVHHTGHLLRDHADRALERGIDERTAASWLRAADAEINDDLVDAGLIARDDPDLPAAFGAEAGRLAEEYFEILEGAGAGGDPGDAREGAEDEPDGDRGGKGGDDGDDGEEQASGESGRPDGSEGGTEDGSGGHGDDDTDDHGQDHDCGSAAHGQSRSWEDGADRELPAGVSDVAADLLRRSVADEVARAASRDPGSVPAGLARWARSVLRPKVDWRRALGSEVRRGLADASGRVDYSYKRPSRRPSHGVVLPSLRHPTPEVAVVVDTSGSMTDDLLAAALAEVEGIAKRAGLRTTLRVLAVDTEVHAVSRVRRGEDVRLSGGGGTDMGAGIAAAAALRPRPQVVVVLTDGVTPWPAVPPPGIRVVVALLGDDASPATVPRWARCVLVDEA